MADSFEPYQSPYPGGLPGHAKGSKTSRAAAEGIMSDAGRLKRLVYDFLLTKGEYGATAGEIAAALKIWDYSAAPRITELQRSGLVVDSGLTRRTARGKAATVWVVVPGGGVGLTDESSKAPKKQSKKDKEISRLKGALRSLVIHVHDHASSGCQSCTKILKEISNIKTDK